MVRCPIRHGTEGLRTTPQGPHPISTCRRHACLVPAAPHPKDSLCHHFAMSQDTSESAPIAKLCLNCRTQLNGKYCHVCGQRDQNRRLPLKSLLHDVIHDLWHLDHKILESLWLLIRRPGFLAEEYLAGRRVRHVPPFRLYVITSFILFLAFSFIHVGGGHHNPSQPPAKVSIKASGAPGKAIEAASTSHPESPAEPDATSDSDSDWERSLESRVRHAQKDPERFYRTFLSNLSKSLFLLMPLFAALSLLLHLRTRSLYVDHLVLALHHHVISFVVILALMGLNALPGRGWGILPGLLLLIIPPVHLTLSLQRLFKRGLFKSAVKSLLVCTAYGLIVTATLVGLLWWSLPKA